MVEEVTHEGLALASLLVHDTFLSHPLLEFGLPPQSLCLLLFLDPRDFLLLLLPLLLFLIEWKRSRLLFPFLLFSLVLFFFFLFYFSFTFPSCFVFLRFLVVLLNS